MPSNVEISPAIVIADLSGDEAKLVRLDAGGIGDTLAVPFRTVLKRDDFNAWGHCSDPELRSFPLHGFHNAVLALGMEPVLCETVWASFFRDNFCAFSEFIGGLAVACVIPLLWDPSISIPMAKAFRKIFFNRAPGVYTDAFASFFLFLESGQWRDRMDMLGTDDTIDLYACISDGSTCGYRIRKESTFVKAEFLGCINEKKTDNGKENRTKKDEKEAPRFSGARGIDSMRNYLAREQSPRIEFVADFAVGVSVESLRTVMPKSVPVGEWHGCSFHFTGEDQAWDIPLYAWPQDDLRTPPHPLAGFSAKNWGFPSKMRKIEGALKIKKKDYETCVASLEISEWNNRFVMNETFRLPRLFR